MCFTVTLVWTERLTFLTITQLIFLSVSPATFHCLSSFSPSCSMVLVLSHWFPLAFVPFPESGVWEDCSRSVVLVFWWCCQLQGENSKLDTMLLPDSLCDLEGQSNQRTHRGLQQFFPASLSWYVATLGKSTQLPVFVNKALLKHSHTNLFMYCLWLLSCYNCRVEQLQQDIWLTKPKTFTVLLSKMFADPAVQGLPSWV